MLTGLIIFITRCQCLYPLLINLFILDAAINSKKKVSNYVVKTRENPKINKTNLDDKTLQYEVSSCRNRINGKLYLFSSMYYVS